MTDIKKKEISESALKFSGAKWKGIKKKSRSENCIQVKVLACA